MRDFCKALFGAGNIADTPGFTPVKNGQRLPQAKGSPDSSENLQEIAISEIESLFLRYRFDVFNKDKMSKTLTNEVIAKLNSKLPQGLVLTEQGNITILFAPVLNIQSFNVSKRSATLLFCQTLLGRRHTNSSMILASPSEPSTTSDIPLNQNKAPHRLMNQRQTQEGQKKK